MLLGALVENEGSSSYQLMARSKVSCINFSMSSWRRICGLPVSIGYSSDGYTNMDGKLMWSCSVLCSPQVIAVGIGKMWDSRKGVSSVG